MTEFESGRLQDGATDARTDLEPRDARALTEVMTVLPEGGDLYTVVGENGGGAPERVAADGGTEIVVAGDEGELLEADDVDDGANADDDGRPDECNCGEWNDGLRLSCWPCYREGFETPASTDAEGD